MAEKEYIVIESGEAAQPFDYAGYARVEILRRTAGQ